MNRLLKLAFKPADYLLNWPDKNNQFLRGPYAPVDEEVTARECEVVGGLPEAVSGEFARNGPNPRFEPKGGYHWFDGDGMIHAVRIKPSGSATFTNRYVKTKKLLLEEEAGEAVVMKFGDYVSKLCLPKMMVAGVKTKMGLVPDFVRLRESTANTSLAFHAGRLIALNEGGLPYALRVMCEGVIETLGQVTFEGEMKTAFTAHPKLDHSTGKLYGFGYQMDVKPFLTMYVLDADGKLERQFPIDIPRGVMMHDFAITENYAIFLDLPMVFEPALLVKGQMPIKFDKTLKSRMGVLPLDATDSSSIRWFDMPETFVAFHVLNAWEEKVEVEGTTNTVLKVVTCDLFEISLDQNDLMGEESPDRRPTPHINTLNLDTGNATRASVLPKPIKEGLDFPQLRQTMIGRKNRFGYFTGFDVKGFPAAFVKVDLQAETQETAEVGRIDLGDWLGGEGLFIPSGAADGAEDDGFLVSYVSPRDCGNSELRVWDAKSMDEVPVATVKIPARVPLGFHAIFVSEADLQSQKAQQ